MARKFIAQLRSVRGLAVQCPHCDEEFPVRRATLFGMHDAYPTKARRRIAERAAGAAQWKEDQAERKEQLAQAKRTKPAQILAGAESSNFGQMSEHVLPALKTFPYATSECRILLKPIDYLVFAGLSKPRGVESIKFVDVKTGGGKLNHRQRAIKDCLSAGEVKHRVIEP